MRNCARWIILMGFVSLVISRASGQCLPLVCSLTLTLQSDASGIALGGSGTNSASLSFGSLQAFSGNPPAGVSKTIGSTNWTISTPFDVKVNCQNLLLSCSLVISQSYTLTAQLQVADTVNTWRVGGVALNSTAASTLTSTGAYRQATAYVFALTIPFAEPSGTISNTVNLVAISN